MLSLLSLALLPASVMASIITAAPHIFNRQYGGSDACSTFSLYDAICESLTPGFDDYPVSDQASCFCYSNDDWAPTIYDDYLGSCLSYVSAADPEDYSLYGFDSIEPDFCSSVGDIREVGTAEATDFTTDSTASGTIFGGGTFFSSTEAPSTTAAPTTTATASSDDANSEGCDTAFDTIQSSCERGTASFTDLAFASQASCLCYQGNQYAPDRWDDPWSSCLDYYSTASPSFYASLGDDGGDDIVRAPCASIGAVRTEQITTDEGLGGGTAGVGPGLTGLTAEQTTTNSPRMPTSTSSPSPATTSNGGSGSGGGSGDSGVNNPVGDGASGLVVGTSLSILAALQIAIMALL